MGGGAVQGLIMDNHREDAMTQARQPEGVQRSDAGAPAQPMHVLVDATVGTPQRAYQEGWNACADAMLTATGETRDQLAKRLPAQATDCLGDGLAGWIAVSDRLPGPMEFCDWLMPPTELKRERWILANECLVTASLPGKATHWRASTPLPPAPKE